MPSVLDTILGLLISALATGVIAVSIWRGCVRKYLFVNVSVAVMLLCDGLRYVALYKYGFSSKQYFMVFYLSDAMLVAAMYLLILSFFDVIFGGTPLASQVRWALGIFTLLVALVSYSMLSRTLPHFYSRLLVEFLQNMYFAAVLLTVLLWISLNHLRIQDTQMGLLIAGLGLSLSIQAGGYALQNLLPRDMFETMGFLMRRVPAVATLVKYGLWCYALAAVTEQMRVAGREPVLVRVTAKGT
jgi:hypothetical protein